jgi:hypothetical protein
MGKIRSGNGEDATRLLIEPMDNPGTKVAVDRGQGAEVMKQSVHQRSLMVTGSGMNNHSRWLIDNHHVFILIKDRQGQFFGLGAERWKRCWHDRNRFSAFNYVRRSGWLAIDGNQARLDPGLQSGAAKFRQSFVQKGIEALAGIVWPGD